MSLDRDRWLRIDELFDRVSALEGEARAELLRTECGDDTELRAQSRRCCALMTPMCPCSTAATMR